MDALKRLFAAAKHIDKYDGTDDAEIVAADEAEARLRRLFETHGEALVEALHRIVDDRSVSAEEVLCAFRDARSLLVTLEREAGE